MQTVDECEMQRLRSVQALGTLGVTPDPQLDALCRAAQALFSTDMAAVTLVDDNAMWYVAKCGLNLPGEPRIDSFCHYAIASNDVMVVEDADKDPRFANGPMASKGLGLRFYAGAPLVLPDGMRVGTLCLIHGAPKTFSPKERSHLTNLACVALSMLTLLSTSRAARHDHERYESVLATAQDAFVGSNKDGLVTEWNPAAERIFGWTALEAIGRSIAELIVPARQRAAHDAGLRRFAHSRTSSVVGQQRIELTACRRDGSELSVEMALSSTQDGETTRFNAFLRDISDRKQREAALERSETCLRESESRLALALESGCDGMWEWRPGSLWFSDQLPSLLGYEVGEIQVNYKSWSDHVHPEDRPSTMAHLSSHIAGKTPIYECEYRLQRKDGDFVWVAARGKAVETAADGKALRVIGTVTDVTQRKEAEARIAYLAGHDVLTNLPNRLLFNDRVASRLKECDGPSGRAALLWGDLDRFKAVNDVLGHHAGDVVLAEVARRLRVAVRSRDAVARLGGDEFAILCMESDFDAGGVAALAERLIASISMPIDIGGHCVEIGISLGIAMVPAGAIDADALFKRADLALYRAKADGRNVFRFYEAAMDEAVAASRKLETDLRDAIARGELDVAYQPIVDATSGRISGAEALARWHHPTRGSIPPSEFIPIAERTGLIPRIGAFVLRKACHDAVAWPVAIKIAVNVSAEQLRGGSLIETVVNALASSRLPASQLEIEITETVLMNDGIDVVGAFQRLRWMGVTTALDDFGTGYSSLGYLRKFPFCRLKIDRTFVQDMDTPETARIVSAMVGLGKSLGMELTAEGIETEAQREAMQKLECGELQGYLFGRPMTAQCLANRLREDRRFVQAA